MRRRTALALSIAAAASGLAVPAAAPAKGPVTLAVCGVDGCHRVDRAAVRAGMDNALLSAPRRAEPFFTIRARSREPGGVVERWSLQWLPGAGLVRGPSDVEGHVWSRPSPVLDRALRRAARGLHPKPAGRLGSLRERRPQARVVEVFSPADEGGRGGDGGGVPAGALGAIAVAAVLAGAVLRARRRERRTTAIGPDAAA